jgi:hypothetical protein
MMCRLRPRRVVDIAGAAFLSAVLANAVDAGVALPNLNDGYGGKAPDLGALERGERPPLYGPRPPGP